jgi:hypothetical protein
MNKDERAELRDLAEDAARNPEAGSYFRAKANPSSVIELLDYIEELEKIAQSMVELAPQVQAMGKALRATNEYLSTMVEEVGQNADSEPVKWVVEMIADSVDKIQRIALLGVQK